MQVGVGWMSPTCLVLVFECAFFTKERYHEVTKMVSRKPSAHRSVADRKENRMLGVIRKSTKKENNLLVPLCGFIFNTDWSCGPIAAELEKASAPGVWKHISLGIRKAHYDFSFLFHTEECTGVLWILKLHEAVSRNYYQEIVSKFTKRGVFSMQCITKMLNSLLKL